ncbi:sterol desaturase family protein, partial [Leptospira sp. SA-E8]|uniref:sterol desaturase family protein n=1 Tax=Leptospira sp. SA-E8 TaxID=3422259 RepID=UPI003EB6B661
RVHHSQVPDEGNSNFGQLFSIWDRLLRTLRVRPVSELDAMKLGLENTPPPSLRNALSDPFRVD